MLHLYWGHFRPYLCLTVWPLNLSFRQHMRFTSHILTKTGAGQTCAAAWSSDRKLSMAIQGKAFQTSVHPLHLWHFVIILPKPCFCGLLTRVSCGFVRGSTVVQACHPTLRAHMHTPATPCYLPKVAGQLICPQKLDYLENLQLTNAGKLWFYHLSIPVVFAYD